MYFVIPRELYSTLVPMEMKFLDNEFVHAQVQGQDKEGLVKFLIVQLNYEKNWDSLKSDNRDDFYYGLLEKGTTIV